jgi:hypothetical protein
MYKDKSKQLEAQRRYKRPEASKEKNRINMREYMKERRKRLKSVGKLDYDPNYLRRLRERAMEKLGGARCINCGCDVWEVLEINHIKGGGRSVHRSSRQIAQDVIMGRADCSTLNVLCRVCNALHYVQDILGIKGHHIHWRVGRTD